jgi:hypothetical protein
MPRHSQTRESNPSAVSHGLSKKQTSTNGKHLTRTLLAFAASPVLQLTLTARLRPVSALSYLEINFLATHCQEKL